MSDIISDLGLDEDDIRWYQFAACNNMETNWFYDFYETDVQIAKQTDNVCLHCPVIKMCLAEGFKNKEYGVWGGIYLSRGKIDRAANAHKTPEVWSELEEIHGSSILY